MKGLRVHQYGDIKTVTVIMQWCWPVSLDLIKGSMKVNFRFKDFSMSKNYREHSQTRHYVCPMPGTT